MSKSWNASCLAPGAPFLLCRIRKPSYVVCFSGLMLASSYKPSDLACSLRAQIVIQLPGMTIHLFCLFFLAFFAINAVRWVNATSLSETAATTPAPSRFTSTNNPNVSIRFVTNSGVCETTPGVHQISGYLDVEKNMSMVSISFYVSIVGQSLIWASVVLVFWVSNFSGIGSLGTLMCPIGCFAREICEDSSYDIR